MSRPQISCQPFQSLKEQHGIRKSAKWHACLRLPNPATSQHSEKCIHGMIHPQTRCCAAPCRFLPLVHNHGTQSCQRQVSLGTIPERNWNLFTAIQIPILLSCDGRITLDACSECHIRMMSDRGLRHRKPRFRFRWALQRREFLRAHAQSGGAPGFITFELPVLPSLRLRVMLEGTGENALMSLLGGVHRHTV